MENLRVRLTKQMIQNALIALLEEKPLDKISVTELCQKAAVNRMTFYKYYGSQFDVLNAIVDNIFSEISEIGENYSGDLLFQKGILDYMVKNKKMLIILMDRISPEMFTTRLINNDSLTSRTISSFSSEYSDKQKNYLLKYYQHGCFGLMSNWLHDENPLAVDELLDIVNKLSENR